MTHDELAWNIFAQVQTEYPEAKSWSELDNMCDANEYFLDEQGDYLPEMLKDGRFNTNAHWDMQDKVNVLLQAKAIK
jgi:hypothetical protein